MLMDLYSSHYFGINEQLMMIAGAIVYAFFALPAVLSQIWLIYQWRREPVVQAVRSVPASERPMEHPEERSQERPNRAA